MRFIAIEGLTSRKVNQETPNMEHVSLINALGSITIWYVRNTFPYTFFIEPYVIYIMPCFI